MSKSRRLTPKQPTTHSPTTAPSPQVDAPRSSRPQTAEQSWFMDQVKRNELSEMCTTPMSYAQAPVATGFTESVFCDQNSDSSGKEAFGGFAYVVNPDGSVQDRVNNVNTVPNDSKKYATTPEGSHPAKMGQHVFKSGQSVPSQNIGAFSPDGFERKVPLADKNPNTGKDYIENSNVHPGYPTANSKKSRGSAGCLTMQNDGSWDQYWDAVVNSTLHPENQDPDMTFVNIVRGNEVVDP